jgi:hypothetical protein
MGIGGEIQRAGRDILGAAQGAGREVLGSKTGPEMAAEILLVQPAKIALNIFGISMRTALNISGILAWNTAKLGMKGLAALPMLPFGTGKGSAQSNNYESMARQSPIAL